MILKVGWTNDDDDDASVCFESAFSLEEDCDRGAISMRRPLESRAVIPTPPLLLLLALLIAASRLSSSSASAISIETL